LKQKLGEQLSSLDERLVHYFKNFVSLPRGVYNSQNGFNQARALIRSILSRVRQKGQVIQPPAELFLGFVA